MKSRLRILVPLCAAGLLATGAFASPDPTALSRAAEMKPLSAVPTIGAPAPDLEALAAEDADRDAAGLPWRYAVPNAVRLTPGTTGLWEDLGDGTRVWRLRIRVPGAKHLNLGFGAYHMPPGGRLYLYSPDFSRRIRPFTSADNAPYGELWTPVLRSDTMIVELTIPASAVSALKLELDSVNVGYRGFDVDPTPLSGSCNIDVVCPQGDPWRAEIPSVAVISRNGFLTCTGFLVNSVPADKKPYFMTANHCGYTSSNASTLVAYWNYETSVCGGFPDGTLDEFSSGSFFRAASSPSDFALLELVAPPDPTYGVAYAGWSRASADAQNATTIHHPNVDEKRISFEYQPTTTTSYLGTSVPGDGTHIRIEDWDDGTTEGGSSGSPLFDQNHHVIGQLHGGYASCSSQTSDWYGRFSVSWTGGGTTSSSLRPWLDPDNTGAVSVDTYVPGSSCNGNGVCEEGEDCHGCPADCPGGATGGTCGNHVCETGAGEDCTTCPTDCNGVQSGKPSGRYCCGGGGGSIPVGCNDARCTAQGNTCTSAAGGSFCCGDGTCSSGETALNCPLDCGAPPSCGDGSCSGGETQCSCPSDCGLPPLNEIPGATCNDGVDNDCDGAADGADADCATCRPAGSVCSSHSDCCGSLKCRGGTCR